MKDSKLGKPVNVLSWNEVQMLLFFSDLFKNSTYISSEITKQSLSFIGLSTCHTGCLYIKNAAFYRTKSYLSFQKPYNSFD